MATEEKELSILEQLDALEEGNIPHIEDTENTDEVLEEVASEDDTTQEADDATEDTLEEEVSDEVEEVSEDSQVDDDEIDEAETKDGTEVAGDGEQAAVIVETEVVDYQKQYEDLLALQDDLNEKAAFYEKLNVDIKVNGNVVKGSVNADRLIQAQQLAGNYSKKMAGFSEYKPAMKLLEKYEALKDPGKLNQAMEMASGNIDAIKAMLKQHKIDPMEVNWDEEKYVRKETFDYNKNQENLDHMFDYADSVGDIKDVEAKLEGWDDQALTELTNNPQSTTLLVDQMGSGMYDTIMTRVNQKSVDDFSGAFGRQSLFQKYVQASHEIKSEEDKSSFDAQLVVKRTAKIESDKAEAARVAKVKEDEAAYVAKVAADNAAADVARKAATSVSKRTVKTTKKATTETDPMALTGDDFMKYFNEMSK